MKKTYSQPEIEVEIFEFSDTVAMSGPIDDDGDGGIFG